VRKLNRAPVVAFVSDAIHPYHHGGKELRIHEVTHRIAELAEVHVYTMHWWKGPRVRTESSVTFHAISKKLPLYTNNRRSIKQAVGFGCACIKLLRHRFDVLEADHIPYIQIIILRIVATLKHKRFVVTWHEVWGRAYWRQYLGRLGLLAWLVEWLSMRLPDHIIVVSPQTAERLRAELGPRASITVAPTGIDLEALRTASPDSSPTDLVTVGRLLEHKRIDMLIDAIALLHAKGLPVTCRVIGDGPEREALRQQADLLGVGDSIEFRQDVGEQKELHALLKAAEVFIFPSAREGLGLAVLEALACGLPVVTTSAPDNLAQHLVARSNRGIVCPPSAASLAAAIEGVLTDASASAATKLGTEDTWLAEYSLDTMAERIAEALLQ
jgi:glycosyltransferase involved in cell wall biosynthesis